MNSPFSFLTLPVIVRPGLDVLFCAWTNWRGGENQHRQQQQQESQFHRFGAFLPTGETAPADRNSFDVYRLRAGIRHRRGCGKVIILIRNSKIRPIFPFYQHGGCGAARKIRGWDVPEYYPFADFDGSGTTAPLSRKSITFSCPRWSSWQPSERQPWPKRPSELRASSGQQPSWALRPSWPRRLRQR